MNNKVETQGKTVKDAVAEALLRLGARREEVIVKVVEEPKSGFLGLLGGKPAKVMVEKKRGGRSRSGGGRRRSQGGHSLSDNKDSRRSEGGQKARGESRRGGRPPARSEDEGQRGRGRRPRQAAPDGQERKADEGRNERRSEGRGSSRGRGRRSRPAARTEPDTREKDMKARSGRDQGSDRDRNARAGDQERSNRDNRGNGDRPSGRNRRSSRGRNRRSSGQEAPVAATPNPEQAAAPRQAPAPAPEAPRSENTRRQEPPRPAPARESARLDNNQQETSGMENKPETGSPTGTLIREGIKGTAHAKAFHDLPAGEIKETLEKLTTGMLVRAGFPNRCQVVDGEYLQVRVVTDDASAGMLIGRHGSAVDSVEHLVERMISTAHGDRVKMNLDINNYRRRRQDTLADRVFDAMAKVKETGQEFHMEPMDARDRRLVHLQVAEAEGMKTVTVIQDGAKHVVISLGEQDDAPATPRAQEAPAEAAAPEAEAPGTEG